jgi:acyl-coenzyme A synthetase/AMP-(fatty) acid ligase
VTGYEVRLLDPQGEPAPPGESGRLWVRGGSVARYYWNNPERTAQTMRDGWLDTGDVFRQDADGYFICCGRADDMLKVGGIWCSPAEIEAQLVAHPKVLEAAVVGHPDADGMIKPAAYVVLKDGGDPDRALAEALQTHCKEGLARYKYPRWVNFVDELPKTATGKIQRYKLRRLPEPLPLPQGGGTLSRAAAGAAAPKRRRRAPRTGQGRKDA